MLAAQRDEQVRRGEVLHLEPTDPVFATVESTTGEGATSTRIHPSTDFHGIGAA